MTYVPNGTPSDQMPTVLATGATDVRQIFVSMSARESTGRDADYLIWHSLDHRPEQYRIAGIRHSIRVVSTPECRAARAVSTPHYDAIDHLMTYFFTEDAALDQYRVLSDALYGDRRPFRLPTVDCGYFHLAGKIASPRAVAGADVIPWRPAKGVYFIIEQGSASPAELTEIPGVAGIWWFAGGVPPVDGFPNNSGLQLTYCFLDDDPVKVADSMKEALRKRWAAGTVTPLFAAPFQVLVPFEWDRYLP